VNYLPGGLASGTVTYHACFHDLEDGLQTHVYAPMGLDIRAKWSVGGNMPGETKQPVELGINAPREGLYLREDVTMKCNIMLLSFVKKTFKESHSKLKDRLMEKAHIIESRIANERLNGLKSIDPRERMGHGDIYIAPPPGYQSPEQQHLSVYSDGSGRSINSPDLSHVSTLNSQSSYPGSPPYRPADPRASYHSADNRTSYVSDHRGSFVPDPRAAGGEQLTGQRYDPSQQQQHYNDGRNPTHAYVAELPSEGPRVPPKDGDFTAELSAASPQTSKQKFAAELPA
jgi:hypothetical protein